MGNLSKEDLYSIWTKNLHSLEKNLELIKKNIQEKIGKAEYYKNDLSSEINVLILNYIFLLASWFDCSFNLLMNENSKEGFLEKDKKYILDKRSLYKKWEVSFNLSICKKYNISYPYTNNKKNQDFTSLIKDLTNQQRYQKAIKLLQEIKTLIEIRNKIAHGQWQYFFNIEKTNIVSNYNSFLKKYDNIQKLDILFGIYKNIYLLIKNAVISLKTFERDFDKILKEISEAEKRISNSSYEKYKRKFYNKEKKLEEAKRKYFIDSKKV